jgi:hypothetical protein
MAGAHCAKSRKGEQAGELLDAGRGWLKMNHQFEM